MSPSTAATSTSKATASSEGHPLVTIALFSAVGLLISLAILIADRKLPGEWF